MNSHQDRAERLMEVYRFKEAIPYLLEFLADAPNDARGHSMLARCYLNVEQFRLAESQIKEALQGAPDYGYAHYIHSYVLERLKRPVESRAAIQEALRLVPQTPDYLARSADLWIAESKYDETIRDVEHGLESNPNHVECSCNLAFALMCKNQFAASEEVMKRILKQHPDHAQVHATYGWIARNRGRNKLAQQHFMESLRVDPEYEWAQKGLRDSLNAHFTWTIVEALDGSLLDTYWWIFSFVALYGLVYFGIWQGPWIGFKETKPPTALDTLARVVAAVAACTFCLGNLIGKPLSGARLAMSALGRQMMRREELTATLVAWIFVSSASVAMSLGTAMMHRSLYLVGCLMLWGAVPVTCIWKFRGTPARSFFAVLTVAYFGTAIACSARLMHEASPSGISPWWNWLTATFVLIAAGAAVAFAPKEE